MADKDGRARGGYVEVGKVGLFLDEQPEPLFTVGVSASAPNKDGTITIEIRMELLANMDELARELCEAIERTRRGNSDG